MVFKQSFKYLKNEKINLSKVILKLECMFYQNIYIFIISSYFIFVEPFRLKQIQKRSNSNKKNLPFKELNEQLNRHNLTNAFQTQQR
jgi:hypothetical protein